MKILRLTDSIITPATADKYIGSTGKSYFNIVHGTKGPNTWRWYAGLLAQHFNHDADSLVLTDNNYNLIPVYKKGSIAKDRKGNVCYNVVIDNDAAHSNDIILLWGIPGRRYTSVTFKLDGSATSLGEGVAGKSRGDDSLCYPAPVIEICGDCTLSWEGLNSNNVRVSQEVSYNYSENKWDIGPLTVGDNNV